MKSLELENILITFIQDNETKILDIENDLAKTEYEEDYIECMNYEISERSDMIRSAKYFIKENDNGNLINNN